jgi:hypothetical protein
LKIKPDFITIGDLFRLRPYVFSVPKFQRGYAWADEQLSDFCRDIEKSFYKKNTEPGRDHFFGGILCAQVPSFGKYVTNNTVVDGQQRLATFVLLASRIMLQYRKIVATAPKSKSIVQKREDDLRKQYLVLEDSQNTEPVYHNRVTLSRYDDDFFRQLVTSPETAGSTGRESHKRLLDACEALDKLIENILSGTSRSKQQIDRLVKLEGVLNQACYIVQMGTDSQADAYMLFQVMNDRGLSLTESDLLRAHTLGLLDTHGTPAQLDQAENIWDEVQTDHPNDTEDYFRWYYSSKTGSTSGKFSLFDDFRKAFFSDFQGASAQAAADTVAQLIDLQKSIHIMRKIGDGEWPDNVYPNAQKFQRSRLSLLVGVLKHNHCMPLLLSACNLSQKHFIELVSVLCKFFFRYKLVCNAHVSHMTTIYLTNAKLLSKQPNAFMVQTFRKELRELIEKRAKDELFRNNLGLYEYDVDESNKELKYLLVTLEENWRWYANGCKGGVKKQLEMEDLSRPFDFKATTIEHLYPRNPEPVDVNSGLEPLKNSLGNLTVRDPNSNNDDGNKPFVKKRKALAQSNCLMTQEVAKKGKWEKPQIDTWKNRLLDAALNIFRV